MSKNPLPSKNPRRTTSEIWAKDGGRNWGGRMGSGCWVNHDPDATYQRHEIDRHESTISD